MSPDNNPSLIKRYEDLIQIGFYDRHMDDLDSILAKDFVYYGTGLDEKGLSRDQFRELIIRMREQGAEYKINVNKTPVIHLYLNNNCSALFVDEFYMDVRYQESQFDINVRHTILFDKYENDWVAVHLHGSVAYDFQPEGNAWPIEEMKKKNIELEALVKQRTSQLNKSIQELRSTQDQLIQSEKMASLGVLVSGIAHEIKNPLNFINNFSAINAELIDELSESFDHADYDNAREILSFMNENINKIKTHSERADAILKSMEMHSPVNSGKREAVDLNNIIESDARLVYYSRFTDKDSETVKINLNLDSSLPVLYVNKNEISRSFINLFSNALDAVNERLLISDATYFPEISVTTKDHPGHIILSISDNGNGVPEDIRDKIFQPFFTTKPTGKGIGLGLSLTYDTVCKLYNGSLNLNSSNKNATEFIISLPKDKLISS